MKPNQESKGRIIDHAMGAGTVSPEQVEERAREIAFINGRPPNAFTDEDREQARRELVGAEETSRMEADRDATAESAPGSITSGSHGHRVETVEPTDEQTLGEKLIQEGFDEAEHEHMVEATKEEKKRG